MACSISKKGRTSLPRKWQAKAHFTRRKDQKAKERALLCQARARYIKKRFGHLHKKTVDSFRFIREHADRLKCHEDVPGAKGFPVFRITSGSNILIVRER